MKKVKKEELIEDMSNNLKRINDSLKRVNCGGCGIFADALRKRLERENVTVTFEIICGNSKIKNLEANEFNSMHNLNSHECYVGHVICKAGNLLLDSEGVYKDFKETRWSDKGYVIVPLPDSSFLNRWLREKDTWNYMFDRDQIPSLRKKVNKLKVPVEIFQ